MQLGKGDQLFKFIGQFRYNWIEDSPPEFLIEISSIKVEFQENKAGEITTPEYLLSIVEIVNSVHEVGTDALFLVKNYVLGLIWGIDYIYLFALQSKDENINLSSSGRAVLLQFDTLYALGNSIQAVYYNSYPLTLYFQMRIRKIQSTVNGRIAIKCL